MIAIQFAQYLCGFLGLALFALYVERHGSPSWRRIVAAILIAIALSVIALKADEAVTNVQIVDQCSETWLRAMYGDWWSWMWVANGCFLP